MGTKGGKQGAIGEGRGKPKQCLESTMGEELHTDSSSARRIYQNSLEPICTSSTLILQFFPINLLMFFIHYL